MKRKNNNITTASLRSFSSRNRTRKKNPSISNNVATNKTYSSSKQKSTTTANKYAKKATIGSASKQTFTCIGCKNVFRIYLNVSDFMKKHPKSNDKCHKAFPKCVCGKIFYDEKHLKSHQSRSSKTKECWKQYQREITNTKFNSSEVAIQPIKNIPDVPSEVENIELNPIISNKKELMISKQSTNFSRFLTTVKFQNMNIHNSKTVIPSKFDGIATIDPNSLLLKQNVNKHGIYCQPISNHLDTSKSLSENANRTQIVDFGDFSSDFNTENNHEDNKSDYSSMSQSKSLSNASDYSSSGKSDNPNQNYKSIMQEVIENESQNDSDFVYNNEDNSVDVNTTHFNSNSEFVCPQQETVYIENNDHFLKMKYLQDTELSNGICDSDYKECLELVTILMKYNVPVNNIYKETMEWKNRNKKLTSSTMTLPSLIKKAKFRVYGESIGTKLSPTETNLICPSGRHVTVTSFDADALIYDMLSDDDLMQVDNLIFQDGNVHNPFIVKDSDVYSDFHTSEFYLQSMKQKNINPEHDVLIPIQLYMDETTLDAYSKLSLHPLVMTLLVFNRQTRNLSMSWRTLAYIPNFDASFGNKKLSVDMKHNDFHFCLNYLLNGLKKVLLSDNGFNWEFKFRKYPNIKYKRKIFFVLGNVLGDAKGSNVLCSRYGNNTTAHIARDCNVLTEDCDNHLHKCTFHRQKVLKSLPIDELKKLCFRRAFPCSAFHDIDFGANCYGINGACAPDPCHMFNKGVVERLSTIFMARLTPKMVIELDKHVGALVTNYGNQSNRDFPNLKVFAKGISSSAKIRSDQHIARVFAIYLVLLTNEFESFIIHKKGRKVSDEEESTRITLEEYNQWVFIFEDTLIMHSWVYLDSHPKYAFKGGKNSIVCDRLRQYMRTYKSYALRKEGMGLKFLKFHQILHLWWVIRLFGSLYNVDTARCESHHKKKKLIGRSTQRRSELFDEQTAMGEYKYNLLIKAIGKAGISLPKKFEVACELTEEEIDDSSHLVQNQGSKFVLTFDYDRNTISANWISYKMKSKSPEFPTHVLDGLFHKFQGYNHGIVGERIKSIQGFTELKKDSNIIRACPSYRGEKNWFDWVSVNWEDYGLLEAQCLLFIDFSTIYMETYEINTNLIHGSDKQHKPLALGRACLVHSIQQEDKPSFERKAMKKSRPKGNTNTNTDSEIYNVKTRLVKYSSMEDTYQIIDVENIHCTSFVIPYEHRNENETYLEGCAKTVMVVTSMSLWHKLFIDYYDPKVIEEANNREDKDISINDERYAFEG